MKFSRYALFITVIAFFFPLIKDANAQYCTSGLYDQGCTDDDYIDDFYLGSIQQMASGCATGEAGYSDYTSLSTTLQQGVTYTMTFSVGWPGDYITAWIDYNNDNIFDSAEQIISGFHCVSRFQDYSVSFTLPSTATIGSHRLRVRDAYNVPLMDPCALYTYGETHDYTVAVTAGVQMSLLSCTAFQPPNLTAGPGNQSQRIIGIKIVTTGSSDPFSVTSFTFNSNGTTDYEADVLKAKIYWTGSDSAFSSNLLFGSTPVSSGSINGTQMLQPGNNYFWLAYDLTSTAIGGDYLDAEITSVTFTGTTGTIIPSVTAPAGFTVVNSFCTGDFINLCLSGDYIDNVTFNTLSNIGSGCSGQAFDYTLYSPVNSFTTAVIPGKIYPITLQSGPEPEGFGVWIDYNNNGNFDDAGEFVYSTDTADSSKFIGSITISDKSDLGFHRMRIRCSYDTTLTKNDACDVLIYGETEDYLINFVSETACTGTPEAGTVQANVSQLCGIGNSATLTATGYSDQEGVNLQWQQSTDGISWIDISDATSNIYSTPALDQSTQYRTKVTCSSGGEVAFSNSVTIDVIIVEAPIATGASICNAGQGQLTATGTGTLNWYDSQTGGNKLGSGSPFTTPFLTSTTTFWVESNESGCAGPRTPVVAVIYHSKIKAHADPANVCAGERTMLVAENLGPGAFNYQWTPILPGMIPADGANDTISVPINTSISFLVTATEINNQCDTSISITVNAKPTPTVSLSGLEPFYYRKSPPDTLFGEPSGGTFSGPGIDGNVFNPLLAGVGGPYQIIYSLNGSNGCTGRDTMVTTVIEYIGINNPTSINYALYPNPANESFIIEIKNIAQDAYVKISTIEGRIYSEANISAFPNTVSKSFDVSQWPKGTYIVEINSGAQIVRTKVVIQ
ncbi:MAG: T9SS type A sorting domain-containing protein [Chitinophagales bacterium]|nr:T9SS type A sorting domain-containing protein [Chitinophagales bacterium]